MERLYINGGKPISGTVEVGGMKNAALPILFATVLVGDRCIIENLPDISDIDTALGILKAMGAKLRNLRKGCWEIDTRSVVAGSAPGDLAGKMRASYYVLGAELARFGKAHAACPGGCDFGKRPVDQHIKGFRALGADVTEDDCSITCTAPSGLTGSQIYMDVVSVGATINIMLAAVTAEGQTVIDNAAREPHIVDVANFLNSCGADIRGAGTEVIKITGKKNFHGVTYTIIPDMIEAGTYMAAAAATGGTLTLKNVIPKHLETITAKLIEMGCEVDDFNDTVTVKSHLPLKNARIKTLPYPGFPTDMHPQFSALLCIAEGVSRLTESVMENRFKYVEELRRMGAVIDIDGKTAVITGVKALKPATVRATDLRAGAAMVIAALATDGGTWIDDIHHIERGYEDMVGKLVSCGADIKKVKVEF